MLSSSRFKWVLPVSGTRQLLGSLVDDFRLMRCLNDEDQLKFFKHEC